jgi:hypothetical protein
VLRAVSVVCVCVKYVNPVVERFQFLGPATTGEGEA